LHDAQPRRPRGETIQIAAHQRLQVCVDGDGRTPLKLSILWKDLVRHGKRNLQLRERAGNFRLVGGIDEGKQEADGDGIDPEFFQGLN
jgi:hypothetical protein